MNISERLNLISDMAGSCKCVCDIGTDHAMVPVKLVSEGKAGKAIAMDIGREPLLKAYENISRANLESKIETRLSDGFEKYVKGEADTFIIAGMGGELITDILSGGKSKLIKGDTVIVSPHTHVSDVRKFLRTNGFRTVKEDMVIDKGKYYCVIKTVYEPGYSEDASEAEDLFGKYLIENKNEVLKLFLEKERKKFDSVSRYLQHIKEAENEMR